MSTLFAIDLSVNMPDGGRHARQLLNLYFEDMLADINETAFNLCDASEALQARKFAKLTVKRADVWPSEQGGLKIFAILSVSGEDPAFIKRVMASFIDGLPGYLQVASGRYFSRSAFPPEISLQPTDWTAEVH